jgi:hypothetical protein
MGGREYEKQKKAKGYPPTFLLFFLQAAWALVGCCLYIGATIHASACSSIPRDRWTRARERYNRGRVQLELATYIHVAVSAVVDTIYGVYILARCSDPVP